MEISEIVTPWVEPEDLLNRREYADFLTAYLSNKNSSFVLNLNASWGMGKTYFLANWCQSIKNTYPTVYVNAWESDFSDDPLLAVMASIYDQLTPHMPEEEQTVKAFSEKLKSGGRFLRGLAPIVIKGLVTKALGEDQTGEAENLLSMSTDDVAKLAEKSMGMMLEDHVNTVKSANEFKVALTDFVKSVTRRELTPPLFLFIDELDRCRPTYAIELLEMVKHLFSVNDVIFVIATDSEQLQHSIKATYGNDFDGAEYLRRFFDQEYKLPNPDYINFCKVLANDFANSDKLEYSCFQPWCINGEVKPMDKGWDSRESFAVFLALLSKHFKISLRSIKQVVIRLDAILDNSENSWDGVFIIILLILQAKNRTLLKWLLERANNNDLYTNNNIDHLTNEIGDMGETVRWFQRHPHTDEFINVARMLTSYIVAIGTINNTSNSQELYVMVDTTDGIESYIISKLASNKLNNIQDNALITYFDHIDMAGALS